MCINVLEHIENDKRALFNIVDGIVHSGHICIIVPAFMCLYGSLDALDGHHRRYSKEQLLLMVKDLEASLFSRAGHYHRAQHGGSSCH